jgi:hypothetical protein
MGLSLEQRKRKLIEDVCASCSGGGGGDVTGGSTGLTGEDGSATGDYDELMKGLSKIRSAKRKKAKQGGT